MEPTNLIERADCPASVKLASYDNGWFDRGRSKWIEAIWLLVEALFVRSWIPGAAHRRILLRLFGARIGRGVDLKPGVHVKFPWRLSIGDHSWIGEDVWIDNLAKVEIGSNCCISQGAYFCTGSHDWAQPGFNLVVAPIVVGDAVWIAAKSIVVSGVTIGDGAVLSVASVATRSLEAWTVYRGHPAIATARRRIHSRRSIDNGS